MGKLYKTIVKDFKSKELDFRINDLDDSLELFTKHTGWQRITDTLEMVTNLQMREMGYSSKSSGKPSLTTFNEGIVTYANQNRYNPITGYLAECEAGYEPGDWNDDNIPQSVNIKNFAHLYFDNPDKAFGLWLFRWMVGAVVRARTGERNPMLVLTGEQEIGKSWFCQWLCSAGIADYFTRGEIKPDNKDHVIRLAMLFLWEVDELAGTTTRRNADALKSFVSRSDIYERFPFGKRPLLKKARCSFIGTANFDGSGILNDPTWSSRFLVTEINEIDFLYSQRCTPAELWGEAAYFATNFPHTMKLTAEENKTRKYINSQYEVQSALGEIIENTFEFTADGTGFYTTQQIQDLIVGNYRIGNSQAFYNELARVMRKNGIQRVRQPHSDGGKRGWAGLTVR